MGEIYLSTVPIQATHATGQSNRFTLESAGEGLLLSGMTFHMFCQSIFYMALLGYRSLSIQVPTQFKVCIMYIASLIFYMA